MEPWHGRGLVDGSAPEADSRQKMRRSLPKTCREATVDMAASVSIVFTALPLTSSSSQLVPCTAPACMCLAVTRRCLTVLFNHVSYALCDTCEDQRTCGCNIMQLHHLHRMQFGAASHYIVTRRPRWPEQLRLVTSIQHSGVRSADCMQVACMLPAL